MEDINIQTSGGSRGQTWFDREIPEEMYRRAVQENGGRVTNDDVRAVLNEAERLGYGATASTVFEQDGRFYVHCHRWNNCD